MQVIFKNKNEGNSSRRTDSIDTILCIERISEYMEGKYTEGFGDRKFRI